MELTLTTHPPALRVVTLPDGTALRVVPDDPSWVAESDPIDWPAGMLAHRLTLLSAENMTGAVTIIPHVLETDTDLPGWTVNPGTPFPASVEYLLARTVPLRVVLRALSHAGGTVTLHLRVEAIPLS